MKHKEHWFTCSEGCSCGAPKDEYCSIQYRSYLEHRYAVRTLSLALCRLDVITDPMDGHEVHNVALDMVKEKYRC